MTRNEAIEAVADYFELDYPETDDNGNYIIEGDYDWEAGCYSKHTWMSLKSFIDALDGLYEDE